MLQIDKNTKFHRRKTSSKLRADLQSPCADSIEFEKRIYINLPDPDEHSDHAMGEVSCLDSYNVIIVAVKCMLI